MWGAETSPDAAPGGNKGSQQCRTAEPHTASHQRLIRILLRFAEFTQFSFSRHWSGPLALSLSPLLLQNFIYWRGKKKKNNSRKLTRQRLTPPSQWRCSARSPRRRIGSEALVFLRTLMFGKQAFACLANHYDCDTVPPLHDWPLSLAKETSRFA